MMRDAAIARNTVWNFAGTAVPIIVAVITIPPLIRGLGTERFGVLTLAWTITGYFALFDLGLGRATTKFVAEIIERDALEQLPQLVWSSLSAHVALGLIGGALLALLTPWLAGGFFNVTEELLPEVRTTFFLLALSVPLVIVTACLRGLLEAVQRFDLVNLIRIPAGIINFVAPLGVLMFTHDLVAVVGAIVASRVVVLIVHASLSFRQLPTTLGGYVFAPQQLWPLLGFGGWITVSSLMSPLVVFIDRFAIGGLISVSAVAYYATPYEVVTKLWIFSASLLAALFPVFSVLGIASMGEIRALYGRACRYLLALVAPCVAVLLAFADDLLRLWIGADFSQQSAVAAKWLALGVLINVVAQVPFTVLQGIGKAATAARLQLAQLPLYVVALCYLTANWGVDGTAIAWAVRAAVDYLLLGYAADRTMVTGQETRANLSLRQSVIAGVVLGVFWLIGDTLSAEFALKVSVFVVVFALFIGWEWRYVLDAEDRTRLIGAARQLRLSLREQHQ